MELIKRKILLENSIDRSYDSPTYGELTATSFYVNVMLTQNIDDMGMFTDTEYIPNFINNFTAVNYSILSEKLAASGITFPFMVGILPSNVATFDDFTLRLTGKTVSDYYYFTNTTITAETESRAEDVRSYSTNQPFVLNFDTSNETYINYTGGTVNGVDRVTAFGTAFTYVFGVDVTDPNIGTPQQRNGLLYKDLESSETTILSFIGEGWNETNTSLSALTKEEYLFGVTSKPEVENDIFIDRGITTIFEKHLKMSEITNLDELVRYGRGFFNVTT